ncbi:MAG: DUF3106 domain-containing protein [Bryobacterales bacterium]|nr:DUF3106 domain-containing protein [Bryobacterales bacterium]
MSIRWLLPVMLGVSFTVASAPAQDSTEPLRPRRALKQGIGKKKGPLLLPRRMEALERMTPEQQERFLNSLPPARRAQAQRQLGNWRELSPEERRRAIGSLQEFRELPPERQRRIRGLFAQFNRAPEERRPALRAELRHLRTMSAEDSRARVGSEEFKNKFSPAEQKLLSDLSDALPRAAEDDPGEQE